MLSSFSHAQERDLERQYDDAFVLVIDKLYSKAVPLLTSLLKEKPDHPNTNYLKAVCLYELPERKMDALPHFRKAVKNTTTRFKAEWDEPAAPADAHYFLGRLYHLDYQFEKAVEHMTRFSEKASKDHPLQEKVVRRINMANRAKEMVKEPVDVDIRNLGKKVNSKYEDYCPVLSLDERELYFTSKRLRPDSSNINEREAATGKFFEDIYVSYKDRDGNWQEPDLLNLNTSGNEATSNLSADGETLYIYKDEGGTGNVYKSLRKEGEKWGDLKPFSDRITSENATETHIDVSADEQLLYFVSDREGGHGGQDIYRCKKLPNGEWSKALNLGPTINTPYDEDGPFIHPDGKTMYFSSKGHNTMGGYDIFYSQLDEEGSWEEPTNMKYPVNTPDDDIYYVTSPDGQRAYFSSNLSDIKGQDEEFKDVVNHGEEDIYMMTPSRVKEEALALLKGYIEVSEELDESVSDVFISVIDKGSGEILQRIKPRSRDGGYVSIIPPGGDYRISYTVNGREFHSIEMSVPYGSEYQEINRAIELDSVALRPEKELASADDTVEKGEKEGEGEPDSTRKVAEKEEASSDLSKKDTIPRAETIGKKKLIEYFGYNKHTIDREAEPFNTFMEEVERRIREKGKVSLNIEGSASKVPTTTYESNLELALERLKKARDLILDELRSRGYGVEKVNFAKTNASVQGPDYEDDAKNADKYRQYQYVSFAIQED